MSEAHTISFCYENDDGDELVVDFPTIWAICSDCSGDGTTYLGWKSRDQPAFTCEDFAEEGPEFVEDYMNGVYDRDCPSCNGTGKVREIDEDAAQSKYPKAFKAYCNDLDAKAHYDSMVRAEQRFGC